METKSIKKRITHLKNLKKHYKGNTTNKTLSDWNMNFKEEYTNLNKILKGI